MEQRLSLVTLGTRDLSRAREFYARLGWRAAGNAGDPDQPDDGVSFYQAGGMVLALWDRASLAEDSGVEDSGGWGGVTLAYNARSRDDVHTVIGEARAAGARVAREPAETFWGGFSGIFIDPDGHPWEVAHNPFWVIDDDGSVRL